MTPAKRRGTVRARHHAAGPTAGSRSTSASPTRTASASASPSTALRRRKLATRPQRSAPGCWAVSRPGTVVRRCGLFALHWIDTTLHASERKQTTKSLYAGVTRSHVVESTLGRLSLDKIRPSHVEAGSSSSDTRGWPSRPSGRRTRCCGPPGHRGPGRGDRRELRCGGQAAQGDAQRGHPPDSGSGRGTARCGWSHALRASVRVARPHRAAPRRSSRAPMGGRRPRPRDPARPWHPGPHRRGLGRHGAQDGEVQPLRADLRTRRTPSP